MREGETRIQDAIGGQTAFRAVSVSELLQAFGYPTLDERSARLITGSLAFAGKACRPDLFRVLTTKRDGEAGAVMVTVTRTPRFALQGVAIAAILTASIGYYRWWPYGALALGASLGTALGLAATLPRLDHGLPRSLPRGRLLGAVVSAVVCLLVWAVFVATR
jgi:hypothetical protein